MKSAEILLSPKGKQYVVSQYFGILWVKDKKWIKEELEGNEEFGICENKEFKNAKIYCDFEIAKYYILIKETKKKEGV